MLFRYVFDPDPEAIGFSKWLYPMFRRIVLKRTKMHGYGLHSREESKIFHLSYIIWSNYFFFYLKIVLYLKKVESIFKADLDALNSFIGDKRFLLGDRVCDADASLFAMLAQIYFSDRKTQHNYLISNYISFLGSLFCLKLYYWF